MPGAESSVFAVVTTTNLKLSHTGEGQIMFAPVHFDRKFLGPD
jgi:hypothetical protein